MRSSASPGRGRCSITSPSTTASKRRPSRSAVRRSAVRHVETQAVARVGRGELARLDADHVPAAVARLGEQEPHPGAEIEQRPAPDVALEALEHGAGRGALAGLLLHVVRGRGVAVGLREHGVGGKALQLHVAAGATAHDVRQRRAEPVVRGDQPRRARLTRDAQVGHELLAPARSTGFAPRAP